MTDVEDIHERSIGPLTEAILRPTLEAGGEPVDTLMLLESVRAAVLAIAVRPAADEEVFQTFAANVRKKLMLMRLGTQPPAGSA